MLRGHYISITLTLCLAAASHAQGDPERNEQVRAIVEAPLVEQTELGDEAIEVRRDIPYTADDASGTLLDVYRPRKSAGALHPVLLYVHGGPLPPGQTPGPILSPKDWRAFRDHGRLAAAHGFVAVIPNHRYRGIAEIEESFANLQAALQWVAENADELGADARRVGIWLFSGAGAHLGWLATSAPPQIRAAAAFYPVAGFAAFAALGLGEAPPEILERWEPATHLGDSMPPLLLARAGKDSPAINSSIDTFVAAATTAGITLDLLLHPSGQHGFDIRDDVPRSHEILARTFAFFSDHLND